LSLVGLLASSASAAFDVSSIALVGVNSRGGYIASLDFHDVANSALVSANADHNFTGMDGSGAMQTMHFSGDVSARSEFGRLHCYSAASAQNAYYNADNPDFSDHDGNIVDENGSPATLVSLAFAFFNDTLQYGGELQAGYHARYIFHVTGSNTGTGGLADLAFQIDNNPGEAFFAGDIGNTVQDWATQSYSVNGITPQQVHVQFSNQVVFDLYDLVEGQDYSGISDFSSTLVLAGIAMFDANDNPVYDGWTVTSESGTEYPRVTPEPATLALLAVGAAALRRRR